MVRVRTHDASAAAAGIESGLALMAAVTGLTGALARADLVVTGEGSFDTQSLQGKVPAVAALARALRVPVVVVAARVSVGPATLASAGITAAASLADRARFPADAMARAPELIRAQSARLVATAPGAGAPR